MTLSNKLHQLVCKHAWIESFHFLMLEIRSFSASKIRCGRRSQPAGSGMVAVCLVHLSTLPNLHGWPSRPKQLECHHFDQLQGPPFRFYLRRLKANFSPGAAVHCWNCAAWIVWTLEGIQTTSIISSMGSKFKAFHPEWYEFHRASEPQFPVQPSHKFTQQPGQLGTIQQYPTIICLQMVIFRKISAIGVTLQYLPSIKWELHRPCNWGVCKSGYYQQCAYQNKHMYATYNIYIVIVQLLPVSIKKITCLHVRVNLNLWPWCVIITWYSPVPRKCSAHSILEMSLDQLCFLTCRFLGPKQPKFEFWKTYKI